MGLRARSAGDKGIDVDPSIATINNLDRITKQIGYRCAPWS